jgi:hypothetical protein
MCRCFLSSIQNFGLLEFGSIIIGQSCARKNRSRTRSNWWNIFQTMEMTANWDISKCERWVAIVRIWEVQRVHALGQSSVQTLKNARITSYFQLCSEKDHSESFVRRTSSAREESCSWVMLKSFGLAWVIIDDFSRSSWLLCHGMNEVDFRARLLSSIHDLHSLLWFISLCQSCSMRLLNAGTSPSS